MLILGAKRLWRYFLKEVQDIGGIQQWLYSELLISHYPTIDFFTPRWGIWRSQTVSWWWDTPIHPNETAICDFVSIPAGRRFWSEFRKAQK